MLQTKLLYYPTISIPRSWANTSLFYFDKISAIVPDGWTNHFRLDLPHNFIFARQNPKLFLNASDLDFLSENHLYEPTNPNLLWNSGTKNVEKFKNNFYEIFNSPSFQKALNSEKPEFLRDGDASATHCSYIHIRKMDDEIYKFLVDNNLARLRKFLMSYEAYYVIENNTASLYISLLAKHLSNTMENSIISSDNIRNWQNISEPVDNLSRSICMDILLEKCLPSPDRNISLGQIMRFKDNHKKDVKKIQQSIHSFYLTISKEESIESIQEKGKIFSDDIKEDLEFLRESMEDLKLQYTMSSLFSSIPMSASLYSFLSTVTIPNPIMAPISIFGGSILSVSSNYVAKNIQSRSIIKKSPYTLIYNAQREGIIRKI